MNQIVKMIVFCFVFSVLACKSITHTTQRQSQLPLLGTLGQFEKYNLKEIVNNKHPVVIDTPILLQVEKVTETPRKLFSKDSTLDTNSFLVFKVLDQFSLIDQISAQKNTLAYLKANPNTRVITQVTASFPKSMESQILDAENVFLKVSDDYQYQLRLHKGNEETLISLAEVTLVDFKASEFCWGIKKGAKIEITDLVNVGYRCNQGAYKSYKRAKKKHEFNF